MRGNRIAAALLFACLLLTLLAGCAAEHDGAAPSPEPESTQAKPLSRQEMIERHLAALHLENAEYEGELSYGELRGLSRDNDMITVYRDPQTEARVLFWQDTGVLRAVFGNVTEADYARCIKLQDADAESLKQSALEYAGRLIAPFLAGELRLQGETSNDANQASLSWNWYEYAGGLPTGTRVYVSLMKDGSLESAVVKRGTVLERIKPEQLIGEGAAAAAAEELLEQTPPEEGLHVEETSCALEAVEDRIYYRVTFHGWIELNEKQCPVIHYVDVDAVTGGILAKTWGDS